MIEWENRLRQLFGHRSCSLSLADPAVCAGSMAVFALVHAERPRWLRRSHVTTWMNTVKTQHSMDKWHAKDQCSMTLPCRVPRSRMYRQQGTGNASCWAGEHRELVRGHSFSVGKWDSSEMDRGEGHTVLMCSTPLTCALKSARSDKCSGNSTTIKRGFKECCPK